MAKKTLKWFKRLFTKTAKPTAALPGGRFVTAAGELNTAAATRSYGISFHDDEVTADDVTAGQNFIGVTTLGVEGLELGATVAKNALVTNDALGRGVAATVGQPVGARILEGGDLGDRVPAELITGPDVAP